MLKCYISFVMDFKGISVSDTEKDIIAIFMEKGVNQSSRDFIVEQRFLKNKNSMKNAVSSLRKRGIIVKDNFQEGLCEELKVNLADVNVIKFILDNR